MRKFSGIVLGVVLFLAGAFSARAAETYVVDMAHSSVSFSVSHMMLSRVPGTFNDFDGLVAFDKADLAGSKFDFKVKVASIDTKNEARDEHLKGADFFDATTYPEITFVTEKITGGEDGLYEAAGKLTLKNVTKDVVIPVRVLGPAINPMSGKQGIGLEARFEVNRQEYGVNWNKTLDNGGVMVGDMVDVTVQVEAYKK